MRFGLGTKSVISIVLLIVAVASILSIFFVNYGSDLMLSNLKQRGSSLTKNLAYNCEYGVFTNDREAIDTFLEGVVEQPDVVYCVVNKANGEILSSIGLDKLDKKTAARISEESNEVTANKLEYASNLIEAKDSHGYYEFYGPIISKKPDFVIDERSIFLEGITEEPVLEEMIGYVRLGISLESYDHLLQTIQKKVIFITSIIIIFASLFTFVLTRYIVGPISRLVVGTRRIAKGDFGFKVKVDARDEIGELADSFNKMSVNLEYSRQKDRQKTEELTTLTYELSRAKDDLEDFSYRLEQKVKEKTKDLDDAQSATLNIMEDLQEAYNRLKNTQEQLIQAEKMSAVGMLASGVAHEVKNPLGIISQATSYLEVAATQDNKDLDQFKSVVNMIKDAVKRADNIVRGLLDYSRITTVSLKNEDINDILQVSLDLVKHRPEFKKIEIIDEKAQALPLVFVDRNKIEQVFINLMTNAMMAMVNTQEKKLIIRSYAKELEEVKHNVGRRGSDLFKLGERAIMVDIEDTGEGISKVNLKRVFDPFFSTRGPRAGAGLGLSICSNIIDLHKGLIEVFSEVGKGTKFTVTLKIAEGS